MLTRKSILSAAVAALFVTSAASAQVLLESFEDLTVGDPGTVGTASGGGPIGNVVDGGLGISEGSQAVRADASSGFYDKIASVTLNGLVDTSDDVTTFSIDWYFEAAPGSAGGYNGFAAAFGGDAGFTQLGTTSGNEFIGPDSGSDGAYTVVYEVTAGEWATYSAAIDAGTLVNLEIFSNKDGNGVVGAYTVDNITFDGAILIPEPASLGLLSVAGLGLLRRRKA